MAFNLTSEITIGSYSGIKAAKVSWKSSLQSFVDTCTIELPRAIYLNNTNSTSDDLSKANLVQEYQFKEDDKISISLGYNGKNTLRFMGFVKKVNQGIPVKLECEGYGYQLIDKMFNRSYASTTVKELLQDLIQGTDIVLSKQIPHIPLKKIFFKNATGHQVLEFLKKECKLVVYFQFNELYAGLVYGQQQNTVRIKIGWNTIKDDDFKKRSVDKKVRILLNQKDESGKTVKTKPYIRKYSNEKAYRVKAGMDDRQLQTIVDRMQQEKNYEGYEGNILLFLAPHVSKGDVVEIDGFKYPDKTGKFFVESCDGEFGKSGGRQTIQLNFWSEKI